MGRFRRLALLGLAGVAAGVPGVSQNPAGGPAQNPAGSPAQVVRDHPYAPEQERNLGRVLLATMLVNAPAIEAPELDRYLDATVPRLADQFPQLQFPLEITVISGRTGGATYEPSTLPGGYIAVPADLILEARREDELVGMLAHAIAHSAQGHPTRVISSSSGGAAAGAPGSAAFSTGGGSPVPVAMTGIQPADEPVADALAAKAMAAAGYDPQALLDYLQRANNFRRLFAGAEVGDDAAARLDELRRVVAEIPENPETPALREASGEAMFDAVQQAVFEALGQAPSR